VCFTVTAGETAHFHTVLSSGMLPSALAPSAAWQTQHVHGIAPNSTVGERHYVDVWNRLIDFLNAHAPDSGQQQQHPPTLFGRGPEGCNACLAWMAKMAGRNNPLPRVQPVEDLIEALAPKIGGRRPVMTETADCLAQLGGVKPTPTQLCSVHAKLPPPPAAAKAFWRCALADVRALCSAVIAMAVTKPPQ